jgi:putative nucleotidyltransferase with HDIG domain
MPHSPYMDPSTSLEDRKTQVYDELGIEDENRVAIEAMLAPLRAKNEVTCEHYEHSIRVALVARQIADFVHQDAKALFYAGLLHDIGKALTPIATLGKTEGWTEEDSRAMEPHPMDAFRLLRGRFDFTAQVVVRHHFYQNRKYPEVVPPPLHPYSEVTKLSIAFCARILALADVYDAMHRINDQTQGTALTGELIKTHMIESNPDQARLIKALYEAGILTTKIYEIAA